MKYTRDTRTITLGLLTITACLLGTVILLVNNDSAVAGSSESRADPYLMCTGKITPGSELIYVIDQESQKLYGYGANINSKAIELAPGCMVDLRLVFESDAAAAPR